MSEAYTPVEAAPLWVKLLIAGLVLLAVGAAFASDFHQSKSRQSAGMEQTKMQGDIA